MLDESSVKKYCQGRWGEDKLEQGIVKCAEGRLVGYRNDGVDGKDSKSVASSPPTRVRRKSF